jgi:hypothetical protein
MRVTDQRGSTSSGHDGDKLGEIAASYRTNTLHTKKPTVSGFTGTAKNFYQNKHQSLGDNYVQSNNERGTKENGLIVPQSINSTSRAMNYTSK